MEGLEYTRVVVEGEFDHSREILFSPRLLDGVPGAHVATPLVRDDGPDVLVNRGFVPRSRMEKNDRPESLIEGKVSVSGILRVSETPNLFTPDNLPDQGLWHWRDGKALSEHLNVAPYVVEADKDSESAGAIEGGVTVITVPNRHVEYAVTWYSLALFTGFMYARRVL